MEEKKPKNYRRPIGFFLVETPEKMTVHPIKSFAGALLSHTPIDSKHLNGAGIMRDGKIYNMPRFIPVPATLDYVFIPTAAVANRAAKWFLRGNQDYWNLPEIGRYFAPLIDKPINIAWQEWHMGLPDGWTEIEEE